MPDSAGTGARSHLRTRIPHVARAEGERPQRAGHLATASTVIVVTRLPCAVSPVTATTTAAWGRLPGTTGTAPARPQSPCFPCMRPGPGALIWQYYWACWT
jgi:hypothetical protein